MFLLIFFQITSSHILCWLISILCNKIWTLGIKFYYIVFVFEIVIECLDAVMRKLTRKKIPSTLCWISSMKYSCYAWLLSIHTNWHVTCYKFSINCTQIQIFNLWLLLFYRINCKKLSSRGLYIPNLTSW